MEKLYFDVSKPNMVSSSETKLATYYYYISK